MAGPGYGLGEMNLYSNSYMVKFPDFSQVQTVMGGRQFSFCLFARRSTGLGTKNRIAPAAVFNKNLAQD